MKLKYKTNYTPAEKAQITSIGPVGSGCDVEIPNNETKIRTLNFSDCPNLESVELPDSIKIIDSKAFQNSRKLKEFLVKYKDVISQTADVQGIPLNDMANMYVDLIMKAKYFEDCLKASSEFDIPLVIVDKTYYFNKMLSESVAYDDETIGSISKFYSQADESKKKQMFNIVAKGGDVTQLMKPKETTSVKISL